MSRQHPSHHTCLRSQRQRLIDMQASTSRASHSPTRFSNYCTVCAVMNVSSDVARPGSAQSIYLCVHSQVAVSARHNPPYSRLAYSLCFRRQCVLLFVACGWRIELLLAVLAVLAVLVVLAVFGLTY
eukprot:m.14341 g.14341  ORF g.14341 m.14341 type:complete len:127 (-) comp6211_c0_seq1:78-458(-)